MDPMTMTMVGAIFGGLAANGTFDNKVTVNYPDQVNYSEATMYASDNNKTVALAQVMSQEFALQQSSVDRQMQQAAQLELGIESLDTKLQTSRLEFVDEMTHEENRHIEKMETLKAGRSGNAPAYASDFPAPDVGDEG